MDSIPRFIACKHDPSQRRAISTRRLEPILSITYGCIVYQEQVIEIFRQLAGLLAGPGRHGAPGHVARKRPKDIEREREAFLHGDPERNIAGCAANGIPEEIAESIYDEITDFANYAFNKAHAVCLRDGGLSDGLVQVPLSQGVYGGPADLRAGLSGQGRGVHRRVPKPGHPPAAPGCERIRLGLHRGRAGHPLRPGCPQGRGPGLHQVNFNLPRDGRPLCILPRFLQADAGAGHEQANAGEPHPRGGL